MTMELLTSSFVKQALQAAVLAGFLCGLAGPLFVWRRLALYGNAISHASLTPIAIAHLVELPFSALLFPFTFALSLLLTFIEERGFFELDSVLSIFFSGLMALGILLMTHATGGSAEAVHFLFGDILMVTQQDLTLLALVTTAVLVYSGIYWRDLVLMSVHSDLAAAEGVPVRRHSYVLMILAGFAVTCVLLLMGAILATSLMIVPPMVAKGFTHSLRTHMIASIFIGVSMTVSGLLLSMALDTTSGPTIAFVGLILFILSTLLPKNLS